MGGRRSSEDFHDDTAEIEYTRAIELGFKHAKPRRKSTFQKRRERKETAVTIFEDVIEDEELVLDGKKELGGPTLLGKPAQRIPGHVRPKTQDVVPEKEQIQPLQPFGQARRWSSIMLQRTIGESRPERARKVVDEAAVDHKVKEGALKKDPRRRTIFVPSDDTTIMTIHPGANTTDRLNDTFQLPQVSMQAPVTRDETKLVQQHEPPIRLKRPRMSLAVAPKRIPLEQVTAKTNVPAVDMPGRNGGKENDPPQQTRVLKEGIVKIKLPDPAPRKETTAQSRLFEPTAASHARQSVVARTAVPLSTSSANTQQGQTIVAPNRPSPGQRAPATLYPNRPLPVQQQTSSKHHNSPELNSISTEKPKTRASAPRTKPAEARVAKLQQYQVLSEDLAQPELYEDGWLSHQEVALAELVNQIFSRADAKVEEWQYANTSARERMIHLYHQSCVTAVHKRLQASLLYGALSRPKDTPYLPNPAHDIGLRKRFLSLWIDSYDEESLGAAAEVIFGRQLPKRLSSRGGVIESSLDPYKGRRALLGFLETFLVEVDDVEEPQEDSARWRKTILRSLMLIWLLDQAKTSQAVRECLFKPSSPRKTSSAMLQALAGMLIPSTGEITRVLRHMDYEVHHVQDPLDEVVYHIGNIAVDLRDGVFLTRLVELLLFSVNNIRTADMGDDATVTIQMPDLTTLECVIYDSEGVRCPRTLSRHLKMPCLGRAQKAFNVDIALCAIQGHGRLRDCVSHITADDLVDGHREKTLSLLWALVSHYGLGELVDFQELAADIKRSADSTSEMDAASGNARYLSLFQEESLLNGWAAAYASSKGIKVTNFTTSFADGSVYAAIVEAFATYLSSKPSSNIKLTSPRPTRLEMQLQALGCSSAFTKQLTSTCGTIPSRQTTISNLAFLASRLLPLARRHNAVVGIQRTFRAKRSRAILSQRIALMRLAHSCATVVQTERRLVDAATVLQRSWRVVLDGRIARLNKDVERFQGISRSWMARRRVQRERPTGMLDKQSLRVMGGW